MIRHWILAVAAMAAGCAKSSVIPLSADTIQLTTGAAPICGQVGAQQVAAKQAAVETIRRGFDRFVIVDSGYQNDVRVVGHTPVIANTSTVATGSVYGNAYSGTANSHTAVSGGQPIVGGSHNQGLVVKMFKQSDPAGSNAVDARQSLGPDWQKTVGSGTYTCL